ncbi:MAG: hypothetical protein V3V33_11270, partial [Candidatus Lokiarchaeia archaeon]
NARTKLIWQCKEGHVWKAKPDHIKRGQWCPNCAGVKKLSIIEMQKLANKKDGKCLSEEYKNIHTKLTWKCKEGHIWKALPSNIKKGHWCPSCAIKRITNAQKLTIKEMQKLAEEKGGKCLSDHYVNARTKLIWQCKEGHVWKAKADHIKNGHWCPKCAGVEKLTLNDMHELARKKEGKCLSEEYINAQTKIIWQCKEGHIWKATPNKIQSGRWCPLCSEGLSERICRRYFEHIFNAKFPKSKFNWLFNNEGNQLELDGYNKEWNIGFEYQGRQHYEFIPFFHRNKETFKKRRLDDKLKKKLCKLNGITLIEVPHIISYEEMQEYIISQCRIKNIDVPNNFTKINYKSFKVYSRENLKAMKDLAKKRGGFCLSNQYLNARTKLKWKCREGHVWKAIPDSIKRGSWCPKCAIKLKANKRSLTIGEMQKLAEKKEGKCLSTNYVNAKTKLIWECKIGHTWRAIPANIKKGHWCPFCARNKNKSFKI